MGKISKHLTSHKWLILITLAVLFMLSNLFLKGHLSKEIYTSGDEPHYLMMTDSLVSDGDFNLKNDYLLDRSTGSYSLTGIYPHTSPAIDTAHSDDWYSIHTIGLPLTMALPYKIFGLAGSRFLIILLQLLSLVLFYKILKKYIKSDGSVFLGMVILLSSTFLWQNLGAIMPDLLIVTLVAAAVLLFAKQDRVSNFVFVLIVVAGMLLHTKAIIILAPIYLGHNIVLIKEWGISQTAKKLGAYYFLLLGAVFLYASFLKASYGFYSPTKLYGENGQLFGANVATNIIAMLFDRAKGLAVYFPVLLVAGPYVYFGFKDLVLAIKRAIQKKSITNEAVLAISAAAGVLLLLVAQIGFTDWSGSFAPSGRYMLVAIYAVVFLIAKYFNKNNKLETGLLAITITISALISIAIIYRVNIFREMGFVYFDAGADNIITQKLPLLQNLPIFSPISNQSSYHFVQQGFVMLLLLIVFNFVLIKLYSRKR